MPPGANTAPTELRGEPRHRMRPKSGLLPLDDPVQQHRARRHRTAGLKCRTDRQEGGDRWRALASKMEVVGLVWIGVRTGKFRETVEFFRTVLELPVGVRRRHFVRFDLPDAAVIELFDPASGEYPHFTTGPVPGVQVTDFDRARSELEDRGCELLLPEGGERGGYRWQHFRAPDDTVWEIVDYPQRPKPRTSLTAVGITKLAWVGTSTAMFSTTAKFYREILGLRVVEETTDIIECTLPDGGGVEAFRRGSAMDHAHFRTGPVPGFGVDSVDRAIRILEKRGVDLIGVRRKAGGEWAHFRAPDGNVYELKSLSPDGGA